MRGPEMEGLKMVFSTVLSAYYASYIVLAGKGDPILVIGDEELRQEVLKQIPAASVSELSS